MSICKSKQLKLCGNIDCNICFIRSFASFEGKTLNGNLKIECWSDENKLKPINIFLSSHQYIILNCDICNHTFKKNANSIKFSWCPFCTNQKLCEDEKCIECFNKSLASFKEKTLKGNNKIDLYSDENEFKPRNIFLKSSSIKVIFNCDNCPHSFSARVSSITNGTWCPYCCIPSQKLCDNNECNFCYKNSFASFQGKTINGKLKNKCLINNILARNISFGSNTKYLFKCDICLHDFDITITHITDKNNWCSYCSHQKLCENNECNFCFKNSLASFDKKTKNGKLKIEYFSKKNKINPRQIFKSTKKEYIFDCDTCKKEFKTQLNLITCKNQWCPYCNNSKGEDECERVINELSLTPLSQIKFKDCKDKRILPFDKSILEFENLLIEFDGLQHFKHCKFFGGIKSYKKTIKHDIMKNKYCLENNKLLLRISYLDIDDIDFWVEYGLEKARKNEVGIIFSDENLYKFAYLPSMKKKTFLRKRLIQKIINFGG